LANDLLWAAHALKLAARLAADRIADTR